MKKLLRIFLELQYLKRVNVIYQYQNVHSKENKVYEDGDTVFIERVLFMDVPRTGEAIIRNGYYFRVATVWHNKDENTIEVDLNDL